MTYYRGLFTPRAEEASFSADAGADYIIDIDEGTRFGADAQVTLNGEVILARRTDRRAQPRQVRLSVRLKESNLLRVTLYGVPWTKLTISVVGGAKILGAGGGTITAPGGLASITVPAGALTSDQLISINTSLPAAKVLAEAGPEILVSLEPDGLRFEKPVDVTVKTWFGARFSNDAAIRGFAGNGSILYWVEERIADDSTALTASLDHFSTYYSTATFPTLQRRQISIGTPALPSFDQRPASRIQAYLDATERASNVWNNYLSGTGISFVVGANARADIEILWSSDEPNARICANPDSPSTCEGFDEFFATAGPDSWRLGSAVWIVGRNGAVDRRVVLLNGALPPANIGRGIGGIGCKAPSCFEELFTHELGHHIGLRHPEGRTVSPPVMARSQVLSPQAKPLQSEDVVQLRSRYSLPDLRRFVAENVSFDLPTDGTVGQSLFSPARPPVTVRDQFGSPVPFVTVGVDVDGPAGSILSGEFVSNLSGTLTLPSALPSTPGRYRISITSGVPLRGWRSLPRDQAPRYYTATGDVAVSAGPPPGPPSVSCVGAPRLGCGFGPEQFATVRGGTFEMGSSSGAADERPVHSVTISRPFLVQRTEVTQGQWRQVMDTNPSVNASCGDSCPVERVSWSDIQEFLRRMNAAIPSANYRLPTEAEWEFAARAGSTGDTYGPLNSTAWWAGTPPFETKVVGLKVPNANGLYDMLGNVMEWCADSYDANYYGSSPSLDPAGPMTSPTFSKVLRGGSYFGVASDLRFSARMSFNEFSRGAQIGFRLVRDP